MDARITLEQVMHHRLTLVIHSTGSGVDDLIANWQRQGTTRIARLVLEETHNFPECFLKSLWAIFGLASPEPKLTLEDGIVMLLNSAAEEVEETLLVLENYHHIHAAEIHAAVSLLLDYLPPRLHLVITSTGEPPLPIPRMRARRQLLEVR